MRIRSIIRIFALLFLASCVEVTISVFSPCQRMTFSDALPVQFWLSDCDTYNETVPKGVHEACFCQPWQCDDEINIQFQDDRSPEADYTLRILTSTGTFLESIPFSQIDADLYAVSFIPNNYEICDEMVKLSISIDNTLQLLDPDEWDDADTPFDSKTSTTFVSAFTSSDGLTGATMPIEVSAKQSVTINFGLALSGTWTGGASPVPVLFTLKNADGEVVSNADPVSLTFNASGGGSATLTATENATILSVSIDPDILTGTANMTITLTTAATITEEVAKSDCLRIATVQDETELFEYSNGRNFAGLIYQDVSPDQSFFIRVPCRFFHEQFPEEDEAIELTSQVVTTSAQLKSQKLLEVQHVPYYFHKKLQLVLKHQSLTIGGKDYKKEEKYEINIGNKKWPLKSATCLLTEKSSVIRNVL